MASTNQPLNLQRFFGETGRQAIAQQVFIKRKLTQLRKMPVLRPDPGGTSLRQISIPYRRV
jgi:hypothetical protein